ncbi:cytotoxic and regulatory T-cell molecule [Cyprinodon tularosa]|uniref:cytotoxic and regulatory T-cell molecule n=1 Tax=Cyprinodon tularosa TaxID=77115 RepID=UPI0018E2239B|nr:cytotoxic and regulatory T-cell molecule [Cyprinodon tularosa]
MKLQLCVFSLLFHVSVAEKSENMTVLRGQTVDLSCSIRNAVRSNVEWRNPNNDIMFFNKHSVLRDRHYSITKLTNSQFSISISNITFKDGGVYTCTRYGDVLSVKTVRLTVLDFPRMSVRRKGAESVVKCSAKANNHPPNITWKFENGTEFKFTGAIHKEGYAFVTEAHLVVYPRDGRVVVECLVHHPDLHTPPLMNFVKVGKQSKQPGSTSAPPSARPPAPGTTAQTAFIGSSSAPHLTPSHLNTPPPAPKEPLTSSQPGTVTPEDPATSGRPPLSTGARLSNSTSPDLIWLMNDTSSSETTTTSGDLPEDVTSFNATGKNLTDYSDPDRRMGRTQNTSLLVLLVTSLIFCLLVVVLFFAIKLRRAHMAWKRENEDSDPSEASSKSKTSQEEKKTQDQRRRGLFNTVFAQYAVEEPAAATSVINPNATPATAQTSPGPVQSAVRSDIKETSL